MSDDETKDTQPRSVEMKWLRDNREWLEREHPGEWVALDGDQLLAIGKELSDVLRIAKDKGVEVPFVDAVKSSRYQGVTMFRIWS